MIGRHDPEADAKATEKYFAAGRAQDPGVPSSWQGENDPYEPKVLVQGQRKDHPVETISEEELREFNFEANLNGIYDEAFSLCLKKHKDYGPLNISRSPGGPLNGLRVRMHDKLARINNLIDSGATPENESLRDSFVDTLNYAAIAIMVLDGNWPEA